MTTQRQDTCSHTDWRYEPRDHYDEESGDTVTVSERVEYSLYADIDLHRMRCSRCGHIRYYSSRAREYYEEGKTEHAGILFPNGAPPADDESKSEVSHA